MIARALAILSFVSLAASLVAVIGCDTPAHWSLPLPALDRVALSVAETNAHDVWIVGGALGSGGNALVLHGDGKSWHRIDPGTDATLWWVASLSDHQWAVGERGTVLAGPAFTVETVPTSATLYGVWESESGTVWVVGGEPDLSGVILQKSGGAWKDVTPAGSTSAYFKVWGASDDDVWICGQEGKLVHWDGSALTDVATGLGRAVPLFTVAGRAHDDVYAVGGLGNAVVLHYDGGDWTRLGDAVFDDTPGLAGVSVDRDGTALLVGGSGAKLRGRPGAFVDESAFATREDLHAVSISGGEIFTVGGNYLAPAPTPRQGVVAHFGADVPSTIQ
jgi:photosystem II stability/assembly factor-like uncharacterized protein